jgi:hypothetical protein
MIKIITLTAFQSDTHFSLFFTQREVEGIPFLGCEVLMLGWRCGWDVCGLDGMELSRMMPRLSALLLIAPAGLMLFVGSIYCMYNRLHPLRMGWRNYVQNLRCFVFQTDGQTDRQMEMLILIPTFKIYVFSFSGRTDKRTNGQTDRKTNTLTERGLE